MPAPSEADLPRLYREVEALRLRNQLDPKRFYKKDDGEGKGFKGLPKYFAASILSLSLFEDVTEFLFCSRLDWNGFADRYSLRSIHLGQLDTS